MVPISSDTPTAPSIPTEAIASDCRHYLGDRPCIHNRLCTGCTHYAPYASRVCVIKLGALGDVIRTLCILPELRRRHPQAQITWITQASGRRMLTGHPDIDRLLTFDAMTSMVLAQEQFDLAICLDKETEPCGLMAALSADKKLGIGLSPSGTPVPLNNQAEHYFHLGLSDELKFQRNTKSYPQLIYEALGWRYRGQRYELPRHASDQHRVHRLLKDQGWEPGRPTVGINVGAGTTFVNKMWPTQRIVDVIVALRDRLKDSQVLLLGGPTERPIIDQITASLGKLPSDQPAIIDSGTDHDEPSFVAVVNACDSIFTGDTMAMHVAIALRKPVVAFLGPTCEQEIDLFGRGEKVIAQTPCAPCYKKVCDHDNVCVQHVPTVDAADAIVRAMNRRAEPQTIPRSQTVMKAA